MLWTAFEILMAVWMLKLVLDFGGRVVPLVFVISVAVLLLRLIVLHTSLSSGGRRDCARTTGSSTHRG